MAVAAASASSSSLSRKPVMVMVMMMMMVMVMGAQAATEHEVGGTPGWSLPSRVNVNYTQWAETQTFVVGDTLFFNYSSAFHNVLQVSKTDYDSCSNSSAIHTYTDGKTIIPLNSTGTLYYICGFPGHCVAGQKVAITVVSSSSASNSSSPSSAPSSSSSPSGAPPSAPSPSGAPPSLTLPPSAVLIITLTAVLSLTIALL